MARSISVTTTSDKTEALLTQLGELEELLELQVFRGASVRPPGDVIAFAVPNRQLNDAMALLDAYGLGEQGGISLSSSEVGSYVPTGSRKMLERDDNRATWEEMEMTISDDSNTSINTLMLMFIAGALSTLGIASSSLHVIIAGMLMGAGFMPMVRMALGLVGKTHVWRYGVADFAKGYAALLVGAVVATLAMNALGHSVLASSAGYYEVHKGFIAYWTTITASSTLASAAAAVAGAILVATKRSVFTSGVMVGLALVPSAAIIGISLVNADLGLALKALARFLVDAVLVIVLSALVLLWAKHYLHGRGANL